MLPDYLRFVKGVVDSPDLPLNVSREMLQHSRQIAQIRKALAKKILDTFAKNKKSDEEKFLEFYKQFGALIKEGVYNDFENKDKLLDLLYFETSHDPTKPTTLEDYVSRMKEDQTDIYYLAGESRQAVEGSPHLEAFKSKGYEVLYFVDPVDEFMTPVLMDYKGKKLKSVGKGTVELGSEEEKKSAKKKMEEKEKDFSAFLKALEKELADHVKEVRLTTRLTSSAACLVGSDGDLSPHIERLMAQNNMDIPSQKRIMELNSEHEIVQKLKARFDVRPTDLELADHAKLLYGQALLAEGSPLPDPAAFAGLVSNLMSKSLGGSPAS